MSSKNKLQEIYQKRGFAELPKYQTQRTGGKDHVPLFISTVILPDGGKIKGDICSNKKMAELNAADKALVKGSKVRRKRISRKSSKKKISIKTPTRKMILVDIENNHKIQEEFLEHLENKTELDIFVFGTTDHPSLKKVESVHSIQIIDITSTRRDAADIALVLFAGMFCKEYSSLMVITRDHFGSALVDAFLEIPIKMGDPTPRKAYHCLSYERALQTLDKL